MRDSQFWPWLEQRSLARPALALAELVESSGGARHCAVVCVDLLEGFCQHGALSSPRINALAAPIVEFLRACHQLGIEDFLFPCDAHQQDSPEFLAFPPHCVVDSAESRLIAGVRELPFAHLFERFDKRSVSSMVDTELSTRLQGDQFQSIVCIGDCTDLCLYHLATDLRFLANSSGLPWRIIVPANLVATYDLPVAAALEIGALPHPGDIMHEIFLYHLELNGIQVVSRLD